MGSSGGVCVRVVGHTPLGGKKRGECHRKKKVMKRRRMKRKRKELKKTGQGKEERGEIRRPRGVWLAAGLIIESEKCY